MNCRIGYQATAYASALLMMCIWVDATYAQRGRGGNRSSMAWKFVSEKYDANRDGKVTADEYTRGKETFNTLDRNGDSVVTEADWKVRSRRNRSSSNAPLVGDVAPDFALTSVTNSNEMARLSDFKGKKPVALLFGSCT